MVDGPVNFGWCSDLIESRGEIFGGNSWQMLDMAGLLLHENCCARLVIGVLLPSRPPGSSEKENWHC